MSEQRWLVTGGLGFIGSAFVRLVLGERPGVAVTVLDAMTYAANPKNLAAVAGDPRYRFVQGDIRRAADVEAALGEGVDAIVNFAAETHVDRSILDPGAFISTDVVGTHVLLEAARHHGVARFVQVSTDEVYGDVADGLSTEAAPLRPRSPYSASKAGGDLQVLAYWNTYRTPVIITRGSNTYGPYQYPEKLIPLFITNLIEGEPVPLYGDGRQVRDWIHCDDHARGILHALETGTPGEVYNIGGGNPHTNREITSMLLDEMGLPWDGFVQHVEDRPGHDRRHTIDCTKARELGWKTRVGFRAGLHDTCAWYRANEAWWRPIKSGEFKTYYARQYAGR